LFFWSKHIHFLGKEGSPHELLAPSFVLFFFVLFLSFRFSFSTIYISFVTWGLSKFDVSSDEKKKKKKKVFLIAALKLPSDLFVAPMLIV
jgi:hypothetical protein